MMDWMKANKFRLYPNKTEELWRVGSRVQELGRQTVLDAGKTPHEGEGEQIGNTP